MKANWYVAKYVSDLRRREPINIGVILFSGESVLSRFLGENEQGVLNGRRMQGKVRAFSNYKAWLAHWREAARSDRPEKELMPDRLPVGTNYFIENGGESIRSDRSPAEMLTYLFGELVARPTPDRMTRADALFDRLRVDIETDVVIRIQVEDDGPRNDLEEDIFFDYRYKNGATTLMRKLTLGSGGRLWDRVNAAVFSFDRASKIKNDGQINFVALCQSRGETGDVRSQLRLLGRGAGIIVLDDPKQAEIDLASILHLPRVSV